MTSNESIRKVAALDTAVPVLMYHSITKDASSLPVGQSLAYSVSISDFNAQLSEIRASNISVVPLPTLTDGVDTHGYSAVITFDDGSESDYHTTLPALLDARCKATFFLSTANIGSKGYVTWSQVREMQQAGMHFGTHAHDHIPLTPLSKENAREQLYRSKAILEERIGTEVTSMSAPFGFINREVEFIARELGYKTICTSSAKMARWGASLVPRVAVMQWTTIEEFRGLITGDWRTYFSRRFKQTATYLPKQVLLHFRPIAPGIRGLKRDA